MSVKTPAHDFELQLRPNDLRSPNYRAEEVGADGITRPVQMRQLPHTRVASKVFGPVTPASQSKTIR
jgi:hypothetical protein